MTPITHTKRNTLLRNRYILRMRLRLMIHHTSMPQQRRNLECAALVLNSIVYVICSTIYAAHGLRGAHLHARRQSRFKVCARRRVCAPRLRASSALFWTMRRMLVCLLRRPLLSFRRLFLRCAKRSRFTLVFYVWLVGVVMLCMR